MVFDLGVLFPLLLALRQFIDDIGFLSIVKATVLIQCCSTSPATEVTKWTGWSSISTTRFMFYDFASGPVHPLPQEAVSGRKHAPGHSLSDGLLGMVPVPYPEGLSLTLDYAVQFVRDFLGRSSSGGLAGLPTSPHGPSADDGHLKDDDDWGLRDLLTSGPPDPCFALKGDFDELCFTCKQGAETKPATMADLVTVADAGLVAEGTASAGGLSPVPSWENGCFLFLVYFSRSTIAERKSATPLRDEFSPLQTRAASIHVAVAVRADAGVPMVGRVQKLERSLLSP